MLIFSVTPQDSILVVLALMLSSTTKTLNKHSTECEEIYNLCLGVRNDHDGLGMVKRKMSQPMECDIPQFVKLKDIKSAALIMLCCLHIDSR